MSSIINRLDANPKEIIHDSQANYQGTRLATAGSDHKVKIYQLDANQSRLIAELRGHDGQVWQVDWSHPEQGNLLASCSYDRKVIIWREGIDGNWEKLVEYKEHDRSVNSVQFAPKEYGLMLACASSDGSISILRARSETDWEPFKIANAHHQGVNSISWAPPISSTSSIFKPTSNDKTVAGTFTKLTGTSTGNLAYVERFVSGGNDSLAKIWVHDRETGQWIEERILEAHSDWVRDVAWAPSIGLPKWSIATCSQDRKVIIWTNDDGPHGNEWEYKSLNEFNDIVWTVSWSAMGNILAVSSGDNRVTLWKEDLNGEFKCLSDKTI